MSYEITGVKPNRKHMNLFAISFIFLIIVNFGNFLSILFNIFDGTLFLLILVLIIFLVFFIGLLLFNEYTCTSDYLKISMKGIEYKSTPVFPHGLLPKKGSIPFNSIKHVSLVVIKTEVDISKKIGEQKNFSELLEKPLLLLINYGENNKILFGERFLTSKKLRAIVLIESGAGLAKTWKKITEKFPQMQNIVNDLSSILTNLFKKN
jgi:hypothetical protein